MIPNLGVFPTIWKQKEASPDERRHLMLAGLHQDVFLSQWGRPQIEINLDLLEGFYKRDSVAISKEVTGEGDHSVWIYKEKDRIFFFTRKKLVFHFKWSDFKEKYSLHTKGLIPRTPGNPFTLVARVLSLVA